MSQKHAHFLRFLMKNPKTRIWVEFFDRIDNNNNSLDDIYENKLMPLWIEYLYSKHGVSFDWTTLQHFNMKAEECSYLGIFSSFAWEFDKNEHKKKFIQEFQTTKQSKKFLLYHLLEEPKKKKAKRNILEALLRGFSPLSMNCIRRLKYLDDFVVFYDLFLNSIAPDAFWDFIQETYDKKYDDLYEKIITDSTMEVNLENKILILTKWEREFDILQVVNENNFHLFLNQICRSKVKKLYQNLIDIEVKNNWLTENQLKDLLKEIIAVNIDFYELLENNIPKVADYFHLNFIEYLRIVITNDCDNYLEYFLSKYNKQDDILKHSFSILSLVIEARKLNAFPILLKFKLYINDKELITLQNQAKGLPGLTSIDISLRDNIRNKVKSFNQIKQIQSPEKNITKRKNNRKRRNRKNQNNTPKTPPKNSKQSQNQINEPEKLNIKEEEKEKEKEIEIIEEIIPKEELITKEELNNQTVKKIKKENIKSFQNEQKVCLLFENHHFEIKEKQIEDDEEEEVDFIQNIKEIKKITNNNNKNEIILENIEEEPLEDIIEPPIVDEFADFLWNVAARECACKKWYKMENSVREQIYEIMKEFGKDGPYCRSGLKKTFKGVKNAQDLYYCQINTTCIIWGTAIEFSEKSACITDIIKVWDICPFDKLNSTVKDIVSIKKQSNDYPNYFIKKSDKPNGPNKYFEIAQEVKEENKYFPLYSSNCSFSLEKFYDISQPIGLFISKSVNTSSSYDPPMFRMEQSEFDVITAADNDSSMILLGRSGTGKTTCAMSFMWQKYYSYWRSNNLNTKIYTRLGGDFENSHLHQIFLTANTVLRSEASQKFNIMKEQYLSYDRPHLMNDINNITLPKHLLHEIPIKNFPLFLTTREWLVMIDGSLENHFFERKGTNNKDLKNSDNFLIKDQFTTMATKMKEMDTNNGNSDDDSDDNDDNNNIYDKISSKNKIKEEIDSIGFKHWYKGRFGKSNLSFDWDLVWKEIYSYIKGSLEIIIKKSTTGHLTLQQYLELGQKMAPNFTSSEREEIYKIFLQYQKYITRKNKYDLNDVVFHCINQLHKKPYTGIPIHRITYDEVQDATQLELYLYFLIIEDKNKFFFTGDTCQTIAEGVGFRFSDLKSIFHFFQEKLIKQNEISQENQGYKIAIPDITNLLRNYRSHKGITRLAAGVVELLKFYFPESFDAVYGDEGYLDGPKPIFISSDSDHVLSSIIYDNSSSELIEFGADQVILVRDEEAKSKLNPDLLDAAICMTIQESKGLEFNDVFIVNFFSYSKDNSNNNKENYRKAWNCIEYYNNEYQEDLTTKTVKMIHEFDNLSTKGILKRLPNDYLSLCKELKHLYVAITRAKKNLIIYEQSTVASKFVQFIKNRNLVDYYENDPNIDDITSKIKRQINKKSSDSDWNDKGEKIYARKNYKGARLCFKKAKNIEKEKLCIAHIMLEDAKKSSKHENTKKEKASAKDKFLQAAEMFYNLGYYQLAAKIFRRIKKEKRYLQCIHQEKRWKHCSHKCLQLKEYELSCDYKILDNDLNGAIKILISYKRYSKLYDLIINKILSNQYNQTQFGNNLKLILEKLEIPINIYKYLFIQNNNENMDFAKQIFSIIPSHEFEKSFRNKDENNKLVSLLSEEFFDGSTKNDYSTIICFRNFHIQRNHFLKAIQLSIIDLDCYFETVRGIMENNHWLDSSELQNQKTIFNHMNIIISKLGNKKTIDDIIIKVSLYISFVKWVKELSNLQIENFDHLFMDLKKDVLLLKTNSSFNIEGYEIIILDYFYLYVEFFNFPLTIEIYDVICTQFYEEIKHDFFSILKSYINENKIDNKLEKKFDYWRVRKNQKTEGFTVTILSPLYKSLYLSYGQFYSSNTPSYIVIYEVLNRTLQLLQWALTICDCFFNEKLNINQLTYDYSHFATLRPVVELKKMVRKFISDPKVSNVLKIIGNDIPSLNDILNEDKYFLNIYEIIQSTIYPPSKKEYWDKLNDHFTYLSDIIVPFLTTERLRKDMITKQKFAGKEFYLPIESQCDYFYQIQFDPRKKFEILNNVSKDFDVKKLGSLIRAENAWNSFKPIFAYKNFRKFCDKIIEKEHLFPTFITIIEIWALRLILLLNEYGRDPNERFCPTYLFVKIERNSESCQSIQSLEYQNCCSYLFEVLQKAFSSRFITPDYEKQLMLITGVLLHNIKKYSTCSKYIIKAFHSYKKKLLEKFSDSDYFKRAITFCFHEEDFKLSTRGTNIGTILGDAIIDYNNSGYFLISRCYRGWQSKTRIHRAKVGNKQETDIYKKANIITTYLQNYCAIKKKIDAKIQSEYLSTSITNYPFDNSTCPCCENSFEELNLTHDECIISKKDTIRKIYHQITKHKVDQFDEETKENFMSEVCCLLLFFHFIFIN